VIVKEIDSLAERGGDAAKADRVIVVGGGLAGLSAAHRIYERAGTLRRPVALTVLESKDRLGGVIATDRFDGFTIEGGADSFITNKPSGIDLCNRLGLSEQLLETDPSHRRSFVVRNGRLVPVPEGFVLMAPHRLLPILTTPILSWRGKLRFLMDLVVPRQSDEVEESLGSFVRRRLGREALDRLVEPLVAGIYTADPNDLSLKATLPQFLAMEREHGSLIRAAWRQSRRRGPRHLLRHASGARYGLFVTLADGMDTLPSALAGALPPGAVRTSTSVRRISQNEPVSPWLVELLDGPPLEADAVIVATEAHASARLLEPQDPALALQLRSIPYASSIIVNIAYRRDQITHPLDGFGAVVPAIEARSILAVSFLSVKFPRRAPAGTVLLRVFLGGAGRPEQLDLDDAAITALVKGELAGLIGAGGEPLFVRIDRHPRAMPQYNLGHLDRVASIRRHLAKYSRLYLTGIAYDGVGIPDCIQAAERTADRLIDALAKPAASAA
jgi:oxygen-dependent protoporphyrinogen oxidase